MVSQEDWDPAGTRILLDAVCASELLNKEGDLYSLVPESAVYLLPGKPTYKGNIPLGEFNWVEKDYLMEPIRSGKCLSPLLISFA